MYEVFLTLGIEAARQVILNEITEVMESSSVYINYHHLSLLCDRMTYSKNMVQVQRNGLLKDDTGPLAKASFEMHTEMFLQAARHGQTDNMRGVSANVMTGQFGSFGTGAFQLILDLGEMEKMNTEAQAVERRDYDNELDADLLEKHNRSDKCAYEAVVISNPLRETDIVVEESFCQDDAYDMGF
jgi:DNA-directed RNA polymerase II subunit RPB1